MPTYWRLMSSDFLFLSYLHIWFQRCCIDKFERNMVELQMDSAVSLLNLQHCQEFRVNCWYENIGYRLPCHLKPFEVLVFCEAEIYGTWQSYYLKHILIVGRYDNRKTQSVMSINCITDHLKCISLSTSLKDLWMPFRVTLIFYLCLEVL